LILLMDQGQIIARGTHDMLVAKSDLYRRLCDLQFDPLQASQHVYKSRHL